MENNSYNLIDLDKHTALRVDEAEVFTRRFGCFSKSDYEVLMFTVFLDSLEAPLRDYDISIALGITESKVRSLRIKSQLLYPKKLDWVDELAKSIEHGSYDKETKLITLTFEDPSVQNLIKNKIEESFGTVERTLNVKHLVLPIESFLLLAAFAEQDEEAVLEKLGRSLSEHSAKTAAIEKKNCKKRFLNSIPNAAAFVSSVLSIYSAGQPILSSILNVIS